MKGLRRLIALALVFGLATGACGGEEAEQIVVKTPRAAKKTQSQKPPMKEDANSITVPEMPSAREDDDDFVADLRKLPELRTALSDPEKYRAQVLFTEVRIKNGKPLLTHHGFRVDHEYFYPASAIKLVAATAALEALTERGRPLGKLYPLDSQMRIFDASSGFYEEKDPTDFATGRMNLAHELKKMLVISDNTAFNRVYAFVGHRELNTRMWKLGLSSVRVRHRLGNFLKDNDDPQLTPEVDIVPGDGGAALVVPEKSSSLAMFPIRDLGTRVGRAHYEGNQRVDEPMDFLEKNRISIEDLQHLLMKIVLPEADDGPLPQYAETYRAQLISLINMLPSQSTLTGYDTSLDEMQKLTSAGIQRVVPLTRAKLYGKSGRAYGFTIENTYAFDNETKRAFFITAAIYTNEAGVVGNDQYEYQGIANPFFAGLGEYCARRVFKPKS